jgi:hypothetical protein
MRVARVGLVAALLLGACNGGDGKSDDTLPPRPSTTATTAPDYSVPAVIDVAYVEKVMAALDRVYGDGIRILARERKITQEFLEHLLAIYAPAEFEIAERAWVTDASRGFPGLKEQPGNPSTKVIRPIQLDMSCVVAAVDRSFSESRSTTTTAAPQRFVALVPKPPARDPRSLNPTPWVIAFDGFVSSPAGAEPETPCE